MDDSAANSSVAPSSTSGGGEGAKKRFEVNKWSAVALWSWDLQVDNCAICRNMIMDQCEQTSQPPPPLCLARACLGKRVSLCNGRHAPWDPPTTSSHPSAPPIHPHHAQWSAQVSNVNRIRPQPRSVMLPGGRAVSVRSFGFAVQGSLARCAHSPVNAHNTHLYHLPPCRADHAFHYHCIYRWLKSRNVCPLDNKDWEYLKVGK